MDPNDKKKALRLLTYGLYIATSRDLNGYAGGTINWLSQSSFSPPLVMAGIQRDSSLHQAIATSGIFAVHIVGRRKRPGHQFFQRSRGARRHDERLSLWVGSNRGAGEIGRAHV